MNEQTLEPRFERDLRAVLEALPPADVPPALRTFVATVPQREAARGRPRPLSRPLLAFAAAVATCAVVVATGFLVVNGLPTGPVPPVGTVTPSPSASPSSSPSAAAGHRALTFRVVPADGHAPTTADLQAVSTVLLDRVAAYGSPGSASVQGTDRLVVTVDVPANDPGYLDRVTATLTAPGQVGFVPLGSGGGEAGQPIDPAAVPLFGGDAVTDASIATDQTGNPTLDLALSPQAAATFATWSAAHIGSQFAITLDGTIELAPIVQSPVTDGRLTVTADPSGPDTMVRVAAVLRSGLLPVRVVLVPSQP